MIYKNKFTQKEIKAFETLREKLYWGEDGIDYLIAYMCILSNLNPKLLINPFFGSHTRYAGYLALPATRLRKLYFTTSKLVKLPSDEQILYYENIFNQWDYSLDSITECVLNLPKKCPQDTVVSSTQLITIPMYRSQIYLTKKDIMEEIKEVVEYGKMD